MSQYSLRSIFRKLDRALLIRYVHSKPGADALERALDDGRTVDEVFSVFDELSGALRTSIETELRLVHDLSTEAGLKCIQQEIRDREQVGRSASLPTGFEDLPGREDKILCVLLHEPKVVQNATLFVHADALSERSWRRFADLPREPAMHLTKEMADKIAEAIRRLYSKEGRGGKVTAERYRHRDQHYVFAFVDDFGAIQIEHDEASALLRRAIRPTFELVFVYDPARGTLDVFARGDKKVKTAAARLFTDAVFGSDVKLSPARQTYNVDILRHRSTALPVSSDHGVKYARLRMLRLALVTKPTGRITFEVPSDGKEKDIYDLMDAELKLPLSEPRYEATMARVQLVMAPAAGEDHGESYSFDIAAPHHCNLRNLPDRIQEIAHGYLREWGVSAH